MSETIIAPSVLSADFSRLGDEVEAVIAAGGDWGPPRCDGRPFCTEHYLRPNSDQINPQPHGSDVRLPSHDRARGPYLASFAEAGADIITVHAEASRHIDRALQAIRALGKKAGLALNPATPENIVEYVLDRLDLILLMTVNPGFGGQAFIPAVLEKTRRVRTMIGTRPIRLEVDGGVTPETAPLLRAAGADVLVAGSAIFRGGEAMFRANVAALRAAADATPRASTPSL